MSKELEALEKIDNELERVEDYFPNFLNCISQEMRIIKYALTPPTAKEVCEELSKHCGLDKNEIIFYRKNSKEFIIDTKIAGFEEEYVWLNEDNCIETITPLPAYLITLIGRFYEGLENE